MGSGGSRERTARDAGGIEARDEFPLLLQSDKLSLSGPIILDSGPLGLVTNPKGGADAVACKAWLKARLESGARVIIPGIADYETRRELICAKKVHGLRRLDKFCLTLEFLPITQDALRRAAELWARVRAQGRPTASDDALDADVILAAQVLLLNDSTSVIATLNMGHLSLFTTAEHWQDIT